MQVEESVSSNNVFSFRQGKGNSNRLVNKNIPGVSVDQFAHIVHCRDSQTEPTVVRSQHPLQNDISLSYFEVEVMGVTSEDSICIGLMAKDNNIKQYPGKNNNSFGYFKGDFFLCKKKVSKKQLKVGAIAPYEKLQVGDYLGMGLNCLKKTIYVVKNGKIILNDLAIPTTWTDYYPSIGVSREDEKVKFVFNERDFKFNYESLKREIEKEAENEIKKQGISNTQIYPLIFQYLSFHGYSKTFEALQQKEKDFYKIPKLCKHPGITHPAINLNNTKETVINEDDEMNEPLRSKLRNRIMSERLDQQNSNLEVIRRKNTEMVVDPQRKESFFQNISNASNYEKSQKNIPQEQEKEQFQEPLDQNQKFLLNQKFQILKLIKQKNIQKAMQIIEKKMPALLEDNQLVAFMKAHIFLRIVKEQSNLAAIAYFQKEKDIISQHTLFPFYVASKDKVEWKPMKYIFTALSFNAKGSKNENGDILSQKQYEHFSNYIKSLIHKKMGYLGCSRLAFFINNTKKILQKIKDYRGMACGIQLTL